MEIDLNTRGKRPKFFENAESEVLMTALLETMSELWATRERLSGLGARAAGRRLGGRAARSMAMRSPRRTRPAWRTTGKRF